MYYALANAASSKLPALVMMEPLVAAEPDNPEYLQLLGRSYGVVGMGHFGYRRGVFPNARKWVREAVGTLERARAAAPDDSETLRWLALTLADLGLIYEQTGEHIERVQTLERALAVLAEVGGRSTRSRRDRLERGEVLVQLAQALADVGRFENSVAPLREANDCLVPLFQENPEAVNVRYWLALDRQEQARAAEARGERTGPALLAQAADILEQIPADAATVPQACSRSPTFMSGSARQSSGMANSGLRNAKSSAGDSPWP